MSNTASWTRTFEDVRDRTGIEQYKLYPHPTISGNSYRLRFSSSRNYVYSFFDGTGDSYDVVASGAGIHYYLDFTSDAPELLFVTGNQLNAVPDPTSNPPEGSNPNPPTGFDPNPPQDPYTNPGQDLTLARR